MRARTYARTNIRQMVIFGGVGFAVGWVLNVWVMASIYDGFRTPSGAPATGTGNLFQGTLFYMAASALISSTISYRLLVGSQRFWREIYAVPSNIKQAFSSDGDATLVHVLSGFSAGTLIVLIVGPSLAAALAFGALLVFTPALRPVVTGVLLTGYRWIVGRVAPKRTSMPPTVSMLVGVTGSIGAFGLGGVLPTSSSLVVGLVAVVVAIVVAQRNKRSASVVLVALGTGAIAYWFGDVAVALADDGGMAECGNPGWSDWWSNCGGSATVRDRAWIGGGGAGIGAVLGAALGGSADTATDGGPADDGSDGGGPSTDDDGPPRFEDLLPGQQRQWLIRGIRQRHPDWDARQITREIDRIMVGIHGPEVDERTRIQRLQEGMQYTLDWWSSTADSTRRRVSAEARMLLHLDGGHFWTHFVGNYTEDVMSGEAIRRGGLTARETVTQTWEKSEAIVSALGSSEVRGEVFDWLMSGEPRELARNPALAAFNLTADEIQRVQQKFSELERASGGERIDNEAVARIIGDLASDAEVGAVIGGMTEAVMVRGSGGLDYLTTKADELAPPVRPPVRDSTPEWRRVQDQDRSLTDTRYWNERNTPDHLLEGYGARDSDDLRRMLNDVQDTERIPLTPEEASRYLGTEEDVLLELRAQSLQSGTGTSAADRPWVELKPGSEDALRLRESGYTGPDGQRMEYQGKTNFVKDKSYMRGEEEFGAPPDALPGETVNYRPEHPDLQARLAELDNTNPELSMRLRERLEESPWPPGEVRSGEMFDRNGNTVMGQSVVHEGRVMTRHQTGTLEIDGQVNPEWSDWHRTSGDSDTYAHAAPGVGDEYAARLPAQAGRGTIPGEGNTPFWDISQPPYNNEPKWVLLKYKVLRKGWDEGVVTVDADGYFLSRPGAGGQYDLDLQGMEQQLRNTSPTDWNADQLETMRTLGIAPGG